jgi:NitT/TauT family transport system ATP-binding protein
LTNQPRGLLIDEPFGAVDRLARVALEEELLRLWERQTVVFVTHDVGEAVFLANRVVLLSPRLGRIQRIFEVPVARSRLRGQKRLLEIEAKIYEALHLTPLSI